MEPSEPYHGPEQTEPMDAFFRDLRNRQAEKKRQEQLQREEYKCLRDTWKEKAEDDETSGRLELLVRRRSPQADVLQVQRVEPSEESKDVEIDNLFAALSRASAPEVSAM